MLLRLPQQATAEEAVLRLSWRGSAHPTKTESEPVNPTLRLAKLLTEVAAEDELDDGRLTWTWSRHVAGASLLLAPLRHAHQLRHLRDRRRTEEWSVGTAGVCTGTSALLADEVENRHSRHP